MTDQGNEQRHFGFGGRRGAGNHRLRRGIYLLPSFFTVANMLCGFYAILAVIRGEPQYLDYAAWAIGIAILFDSCDGFLARLTHTNSDFGKQFDSLADVVSFGIAPAVLAFSWGVRGMSASEAPQAHLIYQFGWWVSLSYVVCCAWRLARFNVHGMAPGGSRYFVGMPTPAAAGLIAASVHAFRTPLADWRWAAGWLGLVFVAAALMVSGIRYRSFKDIPWGQRQHSLIVVLIAVLIAFVVVHSEITLIVMAGFYTISGIVLHVVRVARHRPASPPASHPQQTS